MRLPLYLLLVAAMTALHAGCGLAPAASISGTFENVGNDTVPRFFHKATRLHDGRVLVTGGMTLQLFPPSLISLTRIATYDPIAQTFFDSFAPTGGGPATNPLLATARSSHTQTTLLDGRVLITGGHTGASGTNPGAAVASVEIFNPITGVVTPGPAMAIPRAMHTDTLLADGRVVLCGGGNATWQVFNPASDTWSPQFTLAHSRISHAAVRLADFRGPGLDSVLLIGGGGSGPATMETLDPNAGTTSLASSTLNVGVDDLGAAVLPDGTVLIVGGQSIATGNTVNLAYRYNPETDTLVSIDPPPNRPNGLSDHAVVPMGRYVALFGGEQEISGNDTELDYCAIFDSAKNTWPFTSAMNRVHDDFPAVQLEDGSILLIGGGAPLFGNEAPTNLVEVFVPILPQPGDLNGDGAINELDIPFFVSVLIAPDTATAKQSTAADLNDDDALDGKDVPLFVAVLTDS